MVYRGEKNLTSESSLNGLNTARKLLATGPSRATAGLGKPLSRGPITTSFRMRRDRDAEGVDTQEGGHVGSELWRGPQTTRTRENSPFSPLSTGLTGYGCIVGSTVPYFRAFLHVTLCTYSVGTNYTEDKRKSKRQWMGGIKQ